MDGDGDMDILSASWSPSAITWLENDGNANPSWAAANITTDVNGARSVFAADIDSDGDMDIVSASGYDNTIAWHENDGNANPTWTKADIATDAESAHSVFAADMDGDGDMDILSASLNDDTIAWYENGVGYSYSWDVDGGGTPSNGTYYATVSASDNAGNAYVAGTQSITFTVDTTAPSVSLTNNDGDNVINNSSSVVTITATFNEAMTDSPTITIGNGVSNVTMTKSSTTIWTYYLNMASWGGSGASAVVTVTGSDIAGNAYSGTDSITFTIDNTAPTVNITTSDSDNIVKSADSNITVTATFNEAMATAPRITIGSAVNNTALTATSSTTWTYTWNISSVTEGSYTVTVTGTDLAGNAYAGSDKITITLDSTAPTVTLTNSDSDNLIAASDTVTITSCF